jgi:hypothetical protein
VPDSSIVAAAPAECGGVFALWILVWWSSLDSDRCRLVALAAFGFYLKHFFLVSLGWKHIFFGIIRMKHIILLL